MLHCEQRQKGYTIGFKCAHDHSVLKAEFAPCMKAMGKPTLQMLLQQAKLFLTCTDTSTISFLSTFYKIYQFVFISCIFSSLSSYICLSEAYSPTKMYTTCTIFNYKASLFVPYLHCIFAIRKPFAMEALALTDPYFLHSPKVSTWG